jgi:hypothetical protein
MSRGFAPSARPCSVSFHLGDTFYSTKVHATTMREAAVQGLDFFRSDAWSGPKPGPETVLAVLPDSSFHPWQVRVKHLLLWESRNPRIPKNFGLRPHRREL